MKIFRILLILAAGCLAFPAGADAAETPSPAAVAAIASRQFLIGSWQCSFTVGHQGGTYTTVWSSVLDGAWLEQTYDQRKQERTDAFRAEYFVGYDARRSEWIRFGVMTTGQYFAIRMRDTGGGGWAWTYVSLFRPRAETTKPDTVFTRTSDTEYRVDGPTYTDASGATVTEHHICRKT